MKVDRVIHAAEKAQLVGDANQYQRIMSDGRASFVQLDNTEAAYVAAGGTA